MFSFKLSKQKDFAWIVLQETQIKLSSLVSMSEIFVLSDFLKQLSKILLHQAVILI